MLSSQEVACLLNEQMNDVGQALDPICQFNIMAEAGRVSSTNELQGILRTISATPEVVSKGHKNTVYNYNIDILCPGRGNYNIERAQGVISEIVQRLNANQYAFKKGKGFITLTDAQTKEYNVGGYGENTVVNFTMQINYAENVVTSGDKHWLLDDLEIDYTSESILIDKDGITNKINKSQYAKTLLTGQTKQYNFEVPFSTKDELCIKLQREILEGDLDNIHTLKYYDGVSFTKDAPFSTAVSIFKNSNSKSTKPKASVFNITFTDVDDGQGKTKYYFGLCDTIFDSNSENTRFFEATENKTAKEIQTDYWNNKIKEGCSYEQIKAPNLNSLDITSQIYKNTHEYELFDLVNKNYAVIKVESESKQPKYYYYFVTNASIGAHNQVMFDLKLDTIQTYFFDKNIEFSDCLINKAHLNRWIDNGDGTVSFDGTPESKLFETEEGSELPQRLISREQLTLKFGRNTVFDSWIRDNVLCWVYIFIDRDKKYTVKEPYVGVDIASTSIASHINYSRSVSEGADSIYAAEYGCLCYPIMKNKKNIIIQNTAKNVQFTISDNGLLSFRTNNGDSSYIFGIKCSAIAPFTIAPARAFSFNSSGDLLIKSQGVLHAGAFPGVVSLDISGTHAIKTDKENGLFSGFYQFIEPLTTEKINIPFQSSFNINEIIGTTKNPMFNPKMYSAKYKSLKVCDSTGNSFDYDVQKINSNSCSFIYSEPIQAEVTKGYLRLDTPKGLYSQATEDNYTGLVTSTDNSLPISNGQLAEYLSNNRNFWMQSSFKIGGMALGGAIGTALLGGNPLGAMVGGGLGAASSLADHFLTVDNLKNAPSQLSNASGNAILNMFVQPLGLFYEYHSALNNELEMVSERQFISGYNYNRLGKINDFCNIRKFFNFIQAEINSIVGVSVSNNAKMDIKQRFRDGIRFWNSDAVQYDLENYEKWLET